MRPGVRSLLACAAAALALTLAACDDEEPGESVGTQTLTVYSSLPLHGSSRRQSQDMVNAYKLALRESGGQIGELTVGYVSLDSADPEEGRWTQERVLANARQAVRDPNAIAYLGDLDSAATALSLPLLNEAGVLQVSPSSTYLGLTQRGTSRKGEPERFYPSGIRTFGRVIPADDVQAAAVVRYMRAEGARRVHMLHDRELYGSGLTAQVARLADREGIEIVADEGIDSREEDFTSEAENVAESGADAFFYGGSTDSSAARLYAAVAAAAPDALLFGADGVAETAFTRELPPAAQRRMRITSPALPQQMLPARAQEFRERFRAAFGEVPEPYAVYAYEAMSVALDSIRRAGERGNQRPAVVEAFYATADRDSVLGTYSIDRLGDTSLRAWAGRRVEDSRLVFDRALRVPG